MSFYQVYPKSFIEIQTNGRTRTLRPRFGVGYYFLTPNVRPRVEYGIKNDVDLFQHVRQYLGVDLRTAGPQKPPS